MAKKCPKCQSDNPETATFCAECGIQLPSIKDIEVTETMEVPKEELTTGSTFAGRYQIIEELGKGGMGKVYKVLDKEVNAKVALKLIKPEIASDKKTIERFRNELKVARDIAHKNVCRMYDLGREEGAYYITMEYVSGEDLKSFIRRAGFLSSGKAISIANQVCEGLLEAHRLGVVHRDLKPQNIMIDKEGNARIMDFGIARSLRAKGITGSGVMIGTPEYMSPEQVDGKEADQRADIYSLGVILYEMVTGRVPFEGDTPFSIGVKQKSEVPKPPKEINEQIPGDLNRVILKCMEKDKEKRFQSVGELHSELLSLEKGVPTTERIVPERKPLTSKEITVQFKMKKLFLPGIIFFAVIAIGLFLFLRNPGKNLDPNRVVVAVFENKTGDKNLDNLGYMISSRITQGISQTGIVSVSSLPTMNDLQNFKEKENPVDALANETGAGKAITGSYFRQGENLEFHAEIFDTRKSELLISVEPVSGPIDNPSQVVESMNRQVMGTLATILDKRIAEIWERSHIPDYETYYETVEGRKAFVNGEFDKAERHLIKAIELDPNFTAPLMQLVTLYLNWGNLAEAEAITKDVLARTDLTDYERTTFEYYNAWIAGDLEGQYRGIKKRLEMNPNSLFWMDVGLCANRLNRPREAIEALKHVDPESTLIKGWENNWDYYTRAHHMLGEHKKELKIAQEARKYYPESSYILWLEIRANIALGKLDKVEELIAECQGLPPGSSWDFIRVLLYAGFYTRVHGYFDISGDLFERAIEWLLQLPTKDAETRSRRSQIAFSFYGAERWEDAKPIFEKLLQEDPDNDVGSLGMLGLIAARLGNQPEIERISNLLKKHPKSFLRGQHTFYRARLAAILGEKEEALRLLREAVSQGVSYIEIYEYGLMEFETLRDYSPYKEFMEPRG